MSLKLGDKVICMDGSWHGEVKDGTVIFPQNNITRRSVKEADFFHYTVGGVNLNLPASPDCHNSFNDTIIIRDDDKLVVFTQARFLKKGFRCRRCNGTGMEFIEDY